MAVQQHMPRGDVRRSLEVEGIKKVLGNSCDKHDQWEQMHAQAVRAEEHAALVEQEEVNQKLLAEIAGSLASCVQPHKVHAEQH